MILRIKEVDKDLILSALDTRIKKLNKMKAERTDEYYTNIISNKIEILKRYYSLINK